MTAMKINAWAMRFAPRDLCDLGGLHGAGHLDLHALEIAGEVSSALQPHRFGVDALPTEEAWRDEPNRLVADRDLDRMVDQQRHDR